MRHLAWTSSAIVIVLTASIVVHVSTGGASSQGNIAALAQSPVPASPIPGASAVANPHGDLRVACEVCHTAESWNVLRAAGGFDHATTGFPLAGGHRSASCGSCHKSLEFARVATSCADCHRDVHDGKNGFRCQDCHTGDHWAARSDAVRLHAASGFTLRGAHALVECSRCHAGEAGTHVAAVSRECIACHTADYAAASNPNHAAAGYSTSCSDCHDAGGITWSGAGFDHASTGFRLTGAHRAQACTTCHGGGTYTGLSRDCFACHQTDYDATRNPEHRAAGFGTACASCHSTTTWSGATFDHDGRYFRIYSGKHQGKWSSCTQCHTNQADYRVFNCLSCHGQTETDDKHREVTGYRYESNACYSCHPRV